MIDLSFLNLRNLIQIGPLTINLYGLLYAAGFFYLYQIVKKNFESGKIDKELSYALAIYLIIFSVLGARLFHVLFYRPEFYLEQPVRMLLIWKGGLSIHGGLLGGFIAAVIFFKKYKLNYENNLLKFFDSVTIPLAIFLAIGRIFNLLNGEIIGIETDFSWCVALLGIEGCRHPVQVYAFFKDIMIFIFLIKIRAITKRPGVLTGSFLILYGLLRFIIDLFRDYESYYLGIGVGQYLDIGIFIIGIVVLSRNRMTRVSKSRE